MQRPRLLMMCPVLIVIGLTAKPNTASAAMRREIPSSTLCNPTDGEFDLDPDKIYQLFWKPCRDLELEIIGSRSDAWLLGDFKLYAPQLSGEQKRWILSRVKQFRPELYQAARTILFTNGSTKYP